MMLHTRRFGVKMEQDNKNRTEPSSPILKDALRKLIKTPANEIKKDVMVLFVELFEAAGLQIASNDTNWVHRRATFTAQVEIVRSFLIRLGLDEKMLQPLSDVAVAIKDANSKNSRLLMSENAADKLRLSQSWSANASLFDRAQKNVVIAISKVLQSKNIARDHAHRLLAAGIKVAGQKGTDRSIATWEKQHDDAIVSDRKRVEKKLHFAGRLRAATTAQISGMTNEMCSDDRVAEALKDIPQAISDFDVESLFLDAEITDILAAMKDCSVEKVLTELDCYLNNISVCYKIGAKPNSRANTGVPMALKVTPLQEEVRRENLMSLCAQPLGDLQTGAPAGHD